MFGTNKIRRQRDYDSSGQSLAVQSIFHTIQGEGPFAGRPAVFLRLAGCNLRCYFCDTDFESKLRIEGVRGVARKIEELCTEGLKRQTNLVVITGGEPLLQNLVPLLNILCRILSYDVQIETAGSVWREDLEEYIESGMLTLVCSPKTGEVHDKVHRNCFHWKYLISEGNVSPGDGLPNKSTQVPGKEVMLFRPLGVYDRNGCNVNTIWLQPCEAYKVDYKKVAFIHDPAREEHALDQLLNEQPLADQQVTSSVRDEEQTQRNIKLCAELAMKYNYRVSLQMHKILGLP